MENRRYSLERFLINLTAHPLLQLDPDVKTFLESETLSVDVLILFI